MTRTTATATLAEQAAGAIPIFAVDRAALPAWLRGRDAAVRNWVAASSFEAAPGAHCLVPDARGRVAQILFGVDHDDPWCWAGLAAKLPKGTYRVATTLAKPQTEWAALAWALAGYRFGRYKKPAKTEGARLVWPKGADRARVERTAEAIALVRDLVNTPASDMGPAELADAAVAVAAPPQSQIQHDRRRRAAQGRLSGGPRGGARLRAARRG